MVLTDLVKHVAKFVTYGKLVSVDSGDRCIGPGYHRPSAEEVGHSAIFCFSVIKM